MLRWVVFHLCDSPLSLLQQSEITRGRNSANHRAAEVAGSERRTGMLQWPVLDFIHWPTFYLKDYDFFLPCCDGVGCGILHCCSMALHLDTHVTNWASSPLSPKIAHAHMNALISQPPVSDEDPVWEKQNLECVKFKIHITVHWSGEWSWKDGWWWWASVFVL